VREDPVAQLVSQYHGAADQRAREMAARQLPQSSHLSAQVVSACQRHLF
jgi:hypothetical protein